MNNKKVVRLTESQLHNIIAESVNQILNELNEGFGVDREEDGLNDTALRLMGKGRTNHDKYNQNDDAAYAHGNARKQWNKHQKRLSYINDPLELRQRMNQLGNNPQDTLRQTGPMNRWLGHGNGKQYDYDWH